MRLNLEKDGGGDVKEIEVRNWRGQGKAENAYGQLRQQKCLRGCDCRLNKKNKMIYDRHSRNTTEHPTTNI